jgi:hypothetical protein
MILAVIEVSVIEPVFLKRGKELRTTLEQEKVKRKPAVNKKKHQIQAIWLLTKKKRKFVSR